MVLWRKPRRAKSVDDGRAVPPRPRAAGAVPHKLPLWKRVLFVVAANLLGLGLLGAVGEVACRIFAPQGGYGTLPEGAMNMLRFSEDIYLGWELRPGVLDHNSAGFRGREASPQKLPGLWRIAVLGDSVTYGLHVAADEAYPRVLESLLEASGAGRVEVLNFGVPGYNSFQEYTLLKNRVLPLKPDLVVLTFTPDDVETSPVIIDVGGRKCLFRNQFEGVGLLNNPVHWFVFRHSHLYRFLYKRLVLAFAVEEADFEAVYIRPDVQWENVLRMAELCNQQHTPLLLVLSPFLLPLEGDADPEEIARYRQALDRIRKLAADAGLDVLDLGPLYEKHAGQLKIRPEDHEHLNPRGHRLVAEALREKVDPSGCPKNKSAVLTHMKEEIRIEKP